MGKGIIFLAVAIVLITLPGYGVASIFTLDQAQLQKFGEVYEYPGGGYTFHIAEGNPYNPYGNPDYFTGPIEGGYQFFGQLNNRPSAVENWAEMGIGSVLIKTSGFQRDTLEEIGAADLSEYDKFALTFQNAKVSPRSWYVNLFVETGYSDLGEPNQRYYSGWVQLKYGDSATLVLDLFTVNYLNHVSSIGFAVGSDLIPSQTDLYVLQAYPAFSDLYLNVFDQGTYNSGYGYDSHFPNKTEAGTGQTTYIRPENPDRVFSHLHNAFFVFDLTSANNYITSGKLNLQLQRYDSRDSTESFTVYDVTSPINDLLEGGRGLWSTIGLDLMSGKEYGSATIHETDVGSVISIELSKEALTDMNSSLGGLFAVGVHSTTSDNPEPGVYDIDFIGFGEQGDGVQQLELSVVKTIQDILDFYDNAVEDGILVGVGKSKSADNKINGLRNKIEAVAEYISIGDIEGACDQLYICYEKCDGDPKPKDFVTGDAAEDLGNIIGNFMVNLNCN